MPFESLKAIDHPLVCHVSRELTSGNYASDDFSLETGLCHLSPLSTAPTAGVRAGKTLSQLCDAMFSSACLLFFLFGLFFVV